MPTAVFEEAKSGDPVYAGLSWTDGDASRLPLPSGDEGGPCRCRAGRWSRPPLPLPGRQELVLPLPRAAPPPRTRLRSTPEATPSTPFPARGGRGGTPAAHPGAWSPPVPSRCRRPGASRPDLPVQTPPPGTSPAAPPVSRLSCLLLLLAPDELDWIFF